MSELNRIDEDLPPQVATLAQAMRDLFRGLGISTRRYAARRAYDSSTVSRFLGGRRLPPWEFVLNLLHDVAEERGTIPTEETIGMLRELHTAALQAGSSPVHKMQLLQQQLAQADQETRRAAMRERLLEETLQDREHRIRDLQMRYHELQAASVPSAQEAGDATLPGEAAEEGAQLRSEIRDLQAELGRVRVLHRQAEQRCEQMERQLAEAETTAGRAGANGLVPEVLVPDPGNGLMTGDGSSGTSTVSGLFGATIHGDVNVITNGAKMDEEYARSLTVRVLNDTDHLQGNGLLVDGETVITVGYLLSNGEPQVPGPAVSVLKDDRSIWADPVEIHTTAFQGRPFFVAALRLSEPLPFPDRPLTIDLHPVMGSQLLVSAYAVNDPYSCLLDVKGRTGDWLRVSGPLMEAAGGAPAFSGKGGLAGLIATWNRDKDRGHLLPVSALLALTTVNLNTYR
ncbi:hypothetical protein [Streptomyces sp. NPDC000618]|uniref:hypothetical protein n=1 Tax=Streptomyces sp. NPDC000618 TaxID=3154265 RepID=UPI0033165425